MDILAYISIRNNDRKWSNDDFYASDISTGDNNADYILNKRKENYTPAFLFNVYTFGALSILLIKRIGISTSPQLPGQSMEAKSYKEALTKLTEQIKK